MRWGGADSAVIHEKGHSLHREPVAVDLRDPGPNEPASNLESGFRPSWIIVIALRPPASRRGAGPTRSETALAQPHGGAKRRANAGRSPGPIQHGPTVGVIERFHRRHTPGGGCV